MNINKSYYNKSLSLVYDLVYSPKYIGNQTSREIGFISKFLKKDWLVLDVGCGTGRHIDQICSKVRFVYGIDQSKEMIDIAVNKISADNCKLINIGVENFFIKKKFHLAVMLFTVANHILDEEVLLRALRNIRSALKIGGLLIFDLTNFYSFLDRFENDRTRTYELNEMSCVRKNHYEIDEYNQTFINNESFLFTRSGITKKLLGVQKLRMYSVGEIKMLLKTAGFAKIEIFSDWQYKKSKATKRHIFLCR